MSAGSVVCARRVSGARHSMPLSSPVLDQCRLQLSGDGKAVGSTAICQYSKAGSSCKSPGYLAKLDPVHRISLVKDNKTMSGLYRKVFTGARSALHIKGRVCVERCLYYFLNTGAAHAFHATAHSPSVKKTRQQEAAYNRHVIL